MMTRTRLAAAAALLAATAAIAPADAAQITYTYSGEFTGTLDGNPFDVPAVFTGIGDTDNASSSFFYSSNTLSSLTAVAGGVTYTITTPAMFADFLGGAGFSFGPQLELLAVGRAAFQQPAGSGQVAGGSEALIGYDAASNFDEVPVTDFSSASFQTDRGAVNIYSGRNATFSATVASVSGAVPEPASWAMMIGGIGIAGGALRRRRGNVATTVRFA